MRTIIILVGTILIVSCSQPSKLNDNPQLVNLIKDQELAKGIDVFLAKCALSDSIDRASGFTVAGKYYFLFSTNTCKGHQFLKVQKIPFVRSNVFDPINYLGYYTYKKNVLIFEKLSDSLLINTLVLDKSIPIDVPDENSIEGLTLMGDHTFIAYLLKADGKYQLVCQNPIDFLEPLSNDTAYFGCF